MFTYSRGGDTILPYIMTVVIIISLLTAYALVKEAIEEGDEVEKAVNALGAGLLFFLALGGIVGIIAKTFELWGNSW